MKRLLLPFLLLGLALLSSGISAAGLGESEAASNVQASSLEASVPEASVPEATVPVHGWHHMHGDRPHHHDERDQAQGQGIADDDKQKSEQTNVVDGGDQLIDDVIPIAANIPVIPIQNLNIIQLVQLINTNLDVIPISVCAALSAVQEEADDSECELAPGDSQEMSQLRNMEAVSGNDVNNQENENEQKQGGSDSEQDQDQVNVGDSP